MAKKREKLPCGCKISMAVYRHSWRDWGRVDVSPDCTKPNHREELAAMRRLLGR